ncbi:diguanylate cyclase [Butyrivibrio sp. AE3004]|uniref:diguanylate cyclase n=1 Tax=Butyrivibrio sp. AE3004 TaxID=1506994 RepID=UPI00049448CE|nr:diguanylate cyclase [Butyrivibrio sp. AE3004]
MPNKANFDIRSLRKENKMIIEYFQKCKPAIEENNRYMLRKSCMYISMVLIVMIVVAKLLVPGFKISLAHYLLLPLLGVFFLINLYTKKKKIMPSVMTNVLCLTFYFILFILFIFRDMTSEPGWPAMWFPLYLVVFPTVYIARMYRYGIFEFVLVTIFCICSYFYKSPEIFERGIYLALASYVLSMLGAHIILEVRSQEGLAFEELTKISTIDKLTYLMNKGALLSSISTYFERRRPGEPCGMCIIDVDNFKQVNDNFGHNIGDQLLSNIGDLLRKSFRNSDFIGRFGGDEFIVFMPGLARLDLVEMRCRSLQMMLTDLNLGTGTTFSLSIGAIIDTGDHPMSEVFRMADDALYQSKLMGKNCVSAWVVPQTETYDKPLILLACPEASQRAPYFVKMQSEYYSIIMTHSGDTALTYLSQYHDIIRLVIVDLDIERISGEQVVHYIKDRAGFNHIPVIAVASDETSFIEARGAGADRVFFSNDNPTIFISAINTLINTSSANKDSL